MNSVNSLGTTLDHATVRTRPQHRRGGAGRASRDHADRAAAAARHAEPAHLPQAQPGRPADHVPRPHLGDAAHVGPRRVRPDADRAAHLDGQRTSRRCSSSARRSTPCASSSTRGRWPADRSASTKSSAPCEPPTSICPPASCRGRSNATRSKPAASCSPRPPTARSSSPIATARPVRLEELGRVVDGVEDDRAASWFADRDHMQRAVILGIQRQPGRQHGAGGTRYSSAVAGTGTAVAALGRAADDVRPLAVDPRLRRRGEVHHGPRLRAGGARHLPVPAQPLGHGDPQSGAAAVHHRHVRGRWRRSASASTICRCWR